MLEKKIAVIIITYNSEKWILETLESVKNQTYNNIELIISDDCSMDKTVCLAQKWCNKNKERFTRIKILTNNKNEGVTKNVNRGIKASSAKWIKLLAGDDILFLDCLEKNISYCVKNNLNNLFSKAIKFNADFKEENIIQENLEIEEFEYSAKDQFKTLLEKNFITAPTSFLKKSLIEEFEYFDEKYPMIEDYPMWLKLTENNIKLNFLDDYTVYYRVHDKSLSGAKDIIINPKFLEFRKCLYKNYIREKVGLIFRYRENLMYLRYNDIIKKGNKRNLTIIAIVTYILDPYSYIKVFKKLTKRKGA